MKRNYIGENIRIYRERQKLTQQDLADKVGVTWEMISRYERSASSPMKKLDLIADSLGISESQLLQEHIPEGIHPNELRVPLFVKIPSPARFTPIQTNYFYSCPEWVMKKYEGIVALDTSIVSTKIQNFILNGVIFVSTKAKLQPDTYIVTRGYDTLEIKMYKGESIENVLGVLVSQEVRY